MKEDYIDHYQDKRIELILGQKNRINPQTK